MLETALAGTNVAPGNEGIIRLDIRRQDRDELARSDSVAVRSAERAIKILTSLADAMRPVTLAEVASMVHLSTTTTHRILATLVSLGWVDHPESGRYRLGLGMLGTAALGVARSPSITASKDILSRIADSTGWSAYLCVLLGRQVVDIARSPGRLSQAAASFEFEPGRANPAHAHAAGKALLAYLPEDDLAALLVRDGLRRYTESTITDPDQLRAHLAEVRRKQYATDVGEQWDFMRGFAVPVFEVERGVRAALLSYGRFDLTAEYERSLLEELSQWARELAYRWEISGE